jgi:bis(5'-nucleosyl)-tetraphosphatase (symmetrical)
VVLGNHDLHLLTVAEGFSKLRQDDTLGPILASDDRAALLAWLRSRPLMLVRPEYVVVHAGLLPVWSVDRAHALAREVQAALTGPDYRAFLAKLYGSKPDRWDDALAGVDRLRVIVNAMTRMRFCSVDGVMEFQAKGESTKAPAGFMPWFDVPGRAGGSHRIVCGHWSALGLHLTDRVMALDTGCVWGGALTAVRLEDRQVFQVPCTAPRGYS